MSSTLCIGALACSSIAQRQILPVLTSVDEFDLCAVASRSLDKGRATADQFSTRSCSYEELLADQAIEAVYVSVPTGLHAEWGRAVLNAGKHLLLEKQATVDFASTKDLIDLGQARGLVVMEALAYVFHPMIDKIRQLATSGEIGELRHVDAYFATPARPTGDIRMDPDLGGGGFLDSAIYPVSFCLNLFGCRPAHFDIVSQRDEESRVDTRGCIQMAWPSVTTHAVYGFGMIYRNEIAIAGECGRLHAERVFTRPPEKTDGLVHIRQDQRTEIPVTPANAYESMLKYFHRRVRGDLERGVNEGDDLLGRMRLMQDLRQAMDRSKHHG